MCAHVVQEEEEAKTWGEGNVKPYLTMGCCGRAGRLGAPMLAQEESGGGRGGSFLATRRGRPGPGQEKSRRRRELS